MEFNKGDLVGWVLEDGTIQFIILVTSDAVVNHEFAGAVVYSELVDYKEGNFDTDWYTGKYHASSNWKRIRADFTVAGE